MPGVLTAAIAAIYGASAVITDPYFNYTTLLLPGTGTNGAQNNTFLDSSSNTFTITRNGNTTQGTFSPFSQTGWGNYFDGTGDYLTVASNSTFAFGTGDFAIAFWIYPAQAFLATGSAPVSMAYNTGFNISIDNVELSFWIAGTRIQSSTRPTPNQWNYVVCTRQSGTAYVYINGTQTATGSLTGSVANSQIYIGTASHNIAAETVVGYLSDVQILGSYLAATVPTSRATSGANTKLLTCQSNRFIDNSTNNFTITRNGDTRVVAFSPFAPSAAWSSTTNGGSGYFDGSGDYLSNTSDSIVPTTGDFTIEGWFYPSQVSTIQYIFGTGGSPRIDVYINSSAYVGVQTGGSYRDSSTTKIIANAWNYIAITRTGSTYAIFVNGVSQTIAGAGTMASTITNTPTYIGTYSSTTTNFTGYICGLRVSTSVRTGLTTLPTSPYTSDANTSLLLNFTNAGIYDATSKNDLETVGNAQISNTTAKWGSTSMSFDGTDDRLTNNNANNPLISLGTGDFTVEGWIYANTVAGERGFLQISDTVGGLKTTYTTGIHFALGTSPYRLNFNVGGTDVSSGSTYIAINTWYHIAATRSSGSVRLFINGTLVGGPTTITTDLTGQYICVGGYYNTSFLWNGYIQDFRITKGYARYTANFPAPTAAFPLL